MLNKDTGFPNRTIYVGDNLDYLERLPSNVFDSVCIDPPYNSGSNYGNTHDASINTKDDKEQWKWNDDRKEELKKLERLNSEAYHIIIGGEKSTNEQRQSYLTFMSIRLFHIHRILDDHGSLFLICDDVEMCHLKTLLDAIFGGENIINLIQYRRNSGTKKSNFKILARNTGHILFYAKNKQKHIMNHNAKLREITDKELESNYPFRDKNGNYKLDTLTYVHRPERDFYGLTKKWTHGHETMEQMLKEGKIVYRDKGNHIVLKSGDQIQDRVNQIGSFAVSKKVYPPKSDKGLSVFLDNLWEDLKPEQGSLAENDGSGAGKTIELMDRILKFVVTPKNRPPRILDCFLGFGTTSLVAESFGYEWIGMEIAKPHADYTVGRLKGKSKSVDEYIEDEELLKPPSPQVTFFDDPNEKPKKTKKKQKKNKISFPDIDIRVKTDPKDIDIDFENIFRDDVANSEKEYTDNNSSNYSKSFDTVVKFEQWVKQGFTCNICYCGLEFSQGQGDHIMPRARDGLTTKDNCQILCSRCNNAKRDKHPDVFNRQLEQFDIYPHDKQAESNRILEHIKNHKPHRYNDILAMQNKIKGE